MSNIGIVSPNLRFVLHPCEENETVEIPDKKVSLLILQHCAFQIDGHVYYDKAVENDVIRLSKEGK